MDGNDNDNHRERESNNGTDPSLPLHRPKHPAHHPPTDATTQQPTTQVHDPSTGGQRHDAVGLMGFDGNNGGGCGRCSAPCSRAVDCMLQTAANSTTPYCCLRPESSPRQKGQKVFATCHRTASNGMMRKPVMSLENHDQMPSHTAGVDRTWRWWLWWPGPRAFVLTFPLPCAGCPHRCSALSVNRKVEVLPGGDL
jgi:hypothetical protein